VQRLHDDLQPLQSLEPTRRLIRNFRGLDRLERDHRHGRDRLDHIKAHRCAAGGKGGAFRQAIATVHQMMALFGWLTEKEAILYTKKADRKRFAREAMHTLNKPAEPTSLALSADVVKLSPRRGANAPNTLCYHPPRRW
jgi:hypothetical protein